MKVSEKEAKEKIVSGGLSDQGILKNPRGKTIDIERLRAKRKGYLVCKRIQDIFFSALALLVLWPLILIVALIIFIDDPKGNPFFVQTRVGKNGKEFRLYKFRTMCVNAEDQLVNLLDRNEMDGHAFKIKDDPRITKVGRILRKTSIDEIPQFLNVLKGDMSLVGPRPPLPREVAEYDEYEHQRLYVRPGLTCYWQILPDRNDLPFDEWMDLDVKYIEERNTLVDWKIIFKTFGAVLGCNGE